jgi:hypothetical protein
MTWAQIRKRYISACGDTAAAREEAWDHLTEGGRAVANDPALAELPELMGIDESVVITADTDNALISAIDLNVFAIQNVLNKTEGFPVNPEPGGMIGRQRYLGTDGLPPSGSVTHYVRDGVRLYVRQTPTVNTTLMVRVRRAVVTLTDSDLNLSPITPSQYDEAIILSAAANYYLAHPKENNLGEGQLMSKKYADAAALKMAVPKIAPAVEDKARIHETMRLRGYSLRPRSFR